MKVDSQPPSKAIDERRQSLLDAEREEGIASWCSVAGRQVEPVDVRIPVKQVIEAILVLTVTLTPTLIPSLPNPNPKS